MSWAADADEALEIAHDQWRTNVFEAPLCWDVATTEEFDQAAKHVRPEDMRGRVLVSAEPGPYVDMVNAAAELGFGEIYVHHVGRDQHAFIDWFAEHVIPEIAN